MPTTPPGLYETLITEGLTDQLGQLGKEWHTVRDALRSPEAPDRISLHLSRVIEQAVKDVEEPVRVQAGVNLARQLIELIEKITGRMGFLPARPVATGEVLRAIHGYLPDGGVALIDEPTTPLLDTTLLTNAPGEPRVGSQLRSEIASANRLDAVIAFVRLSGIRPLLDDLRRHCAAGRPLRVLTTIYTGATEPAALDELVKAGARVRVSYDTTGTRLHAKAWLFHRETGFSTAYIGSSNLTHQAQVTGLEWNVRVSGVRNPDVLRQIEAVFESYWNSQDFKDYDAAEFLACFESTRPGRPELALAPTEVRPEPFQSRLLEQIELARQQGHHRNLLVSATGTGKTVMAALDYADLRAKLPRDRLLFVAHREEILTKSRATFAAVLRDPAFGEEWVNGRRPKDFEHVFASIQSLSAVDLANLIPDHFDVVIVDEFHHAAADSYRRLLSHLKPIELIGLTATPERADGLSVLEWFDGRVAAELRLWDAIDQQRLSPFIYYGIHDGLDLREIPWRRGRGYDVDALTNLITRDHVVAHLVLKQVKTYVSDPLSMRALGYCISVEHARFMADSFNKAGLPSVAVWADTSDSQRRGAIADLVAGRVNVVFAVDLFNEGLDVPTVDTLLMLRPTESATLFLQQLGRGLRKSKGKTVCTVLDFVGHHRTEFKYDRRFRALLGGTRRQVIEQIEAGFPLLPAGCHMELDRVANEIVLQSVRNAVPSRWNEKAQALKDMIAAGLNPSLAEYLDATGLELDDVYANSRSWSELKEAAGAPCMTSGPYEKAMRRAIGRLRHVDDAERIDAWRWLITDPRNVHLAGKSERQRRLATMLLVCLLESVKGAPKAPQEALALLAEHPQVCNELNDLLLFLTSRLTHLSLPLTTHPEVPLQIHGQYTRLEILSAFGLGDGTETPTWREGVYWAEAARSDILVFTIDKSSGRFSPTTRYRDYAISRSLIHWESQSRTRAASETGQRYQQHVARGSSVMLFARKTTDDRAFYFLGPATYSKYEGEAPMAITWILEHRLPGDLFAVFAAAVA